MSQRSERQSYGKKKKNKKGKGKPKGPGYGNNPAALTAPLTPNSAGKLANQVAQLQYGQAEGLLNQRAGQVTPWFQEYMGRINQAQTQQQQMNQPIMARAEQGVQNAGQMTPGIDPGSDAGQDAALAAASRKALADSFVNLVGAQQGAANIYYGQQQAQAPLWESQVRSGINTQQEQLAREKGLARATEYGRLRDSEHTKRLENAAFDLDSYEAQVSASDRAADNKAQRRKDRQSRNDKLGTVNKYGYTDGQWRRMSTGERQSIIQKFDKTTSAPNKFGNSTAAQASKARKDFRTWRTRVAEKAKMSAGGSPNFWKNAYSALVNEQNMDPLLARAVIQSVRRGKLDPKVAKRLRAEYGFVPAARRPIKTGTPYVLPDRPATQPGQRPLTSP